MDRKLKSKIRRYIRDVKGAITASYSVKYVFISKLKSQINDFFEYNPEATFEDMVLRFGPPELIAENFDSACTPSMKAKVFLINAFRFAIILAVFLLIVYGIMNIPPDFDIIDFLGTEL